MVIFHNRGVLHSVVGAFKPEEIRVFKQCNLAGSNGAFNNVVLTPIQWLSKHRA